jgi:crotonobetainyl-CoA:carnitine CoA-transferase CaiB-like acyl-CoA transferase
MSTGELVEAGRLLGLAVSEACTGGGGNGAAASLAEVVPLRRVAGRHVAGTRDWQRDPPLVIDLSALWAGPLCGHLLQSAGARVIKVESAGRPDPVRQSSPALFDLLHAGQESIVLDFANAEDRVRLHAMIARADLVIGSARPRAFEQLDLEPEALIARHSGLTWVAITAHGWTGATRNAVGFGDDAAAAGGLLAHDAAGRPMFAGDALADPLTGIAAAAGAFTALVQGGGLLVDAALSRTAAFVAAGRSLTVEERGRVVLRDGQWWLHVAGASERVAAPRARHVVAPARAFGADTRRVIDQLAAGCGGRARTP